MFTITQAIKALELYRTAKNRKELAASSYNLSRALVDLIEQIAKEDERVQREFHCALLDASIE